MNTNSEKYVLCIHARLKISQAEARAIFIIYLESNSLKIIKIVCNRSCK